MPAEPTTRGDSGPSRAFRAYSATTLRKTFPVQTNRMEFTVSTIPFWGSYHIIYFDVRTLHPQDPVLLQSGGMGLCAFYQW